MADAQLRTYGLVWHMWGGMGPWGNQEPHGRPAPGYVEDPEVRGSVVASGAVVTIQNLLVQGLKDLVEILRAF